MYVVHVQGFLYHIFSVCPTFYQPIDIRLPDAIKEDTREFLAKWQQSDVPSYSVLFAAQEPSPSLSGVGAKILERGRLVSGINPTLSHLSYPRNNLHHTRFSWAQPWPMAHSFRGTSFLPMQLTLSSVGSGLKKCSASDERRKPSVA